MMLICLFFCLGISYCSTDLSKTLSSDGNPSYPFHSNDELLGTSSHHATQGDEVSEKIKFTPEPLSNGAQLFFRYKGLFKKRPRIHAKFVLSKSKNLLTLKIPTLCCKLSEAINKLTITDSKIKYKEKHLASGSSVLYKVKIEGGVMSAKKNDATMKDRCIMLTVKVNVEENLPQLVQAQLAQSLDEGPPLEKPRAL